MDQKSAVILGVGALDGLGGRLALQFGARGHHVFVGGRTLERVEAVAAAVRSAGGMADAIPTDATDEAAVEALFTAADGSAGRLDLAIYNAGNNMPGRIMDIETSFFEHAWRVCCLGGFLFARSALRRLIPTGGNLMFTGASASLRGKSGFGAFNSGKGALRNLAQAIAKEHGPDGVHVSHVVVDGGIDGERLKTNRPERYAERGNEGLVSLDGLARSYEFLYDQPPEAWTFELDIRTSVEPW